LDRTKAAETVASKAAKRIDPVVAGGATQTAQDAATTAQAAIANATTDSTSVLSNTVKAAGEKATQALEDAKQSAKNEPPVSVTNSERVSVRSVSVSLESEANQLLRPTSKSLRPTTQTSLVRPRIHLACSEQTPIFGSCVACLDTWVPSQWHTSSATRGTAKILADIKHAVRVVGSALDESCPI
jgi:hypothetical protein